MQLSKESDPEAEEESVMQNVLVSDKPYSRK